MGNFYSAVVKKDGSLRLCGDYRCTVNEAVKSDIYPLPTVSEIFAKLAGGTVFTKLDLKQAYKHLLVQFGVSTAVSNALSTSWHQPYLDDVPLGGHTRKLSTIGIWMRCPSALLRLA